MLIWINKIVKYVSFGMEVLQFVAEKYEEYFSSEKEKEQQTNQ
jgi:hypothetical protein